LIVRLNALHQNFPLKVLTQWMTNKVPIKHNLMIFLMVRDQRKRPHMQSIANITLKHYTHSPTILIFCCPIYFIRGTHKISSLLSIKFSFYTIVKDWTHDHTYLKEFKSLITSGNFYKLIYQEKTSLFNHYINIVFNLVTQKYEPKHVHSHNI
jgi:hypothetical protein